MVFVFSLLIKLGKAQAERLKQRPFETLASYGFMVLQKQATLALKTDGHPELLKQHGLAYVGNAKGYTIALQATLSPAIPFKSAI
jgi:hypothetical protein